MKKKIAGRAVICVLSISFLLLTSALPRAIAETSLPIGEIVSKGEVMYENAEKTWRRVENAHFPVLPGVKIKTSKGVATTALSNGSTIEASSYSLFSFDQKDRLNLLKGQIRFRVPSTAQTSFRIGNLSIVKSPRLQAGINLATPAKNEDVIGAISIHTDGSLTISSSQGPLFVLKDDHTVLSTVSPKQSVTIPTMVAQVGDPAPSGAEPTAGSGKFLGLSTWAWAGVGLAAAGGGAAAGVAIANNNDDDHSSCP